MQNLFCVAVFFARTNVCVSVCVCVGGDTQCLVPPPLQP